jgi:DNA recombination protein RmuC
MEYAPVWLASGITAVIAGVLGWLLSRLRVSSQSAAAVAGAKAELQVEIATMSERLRAADVRLHVQTEQENRLLAERDAADQKLSNTEAQVANLRQEHGRLSAELDSNRDSVQRLTLERDEARRRLGDAAGQSSQLNEQLVDLKVRAEKDRENFEQQLQLLREAKGELTEQFKNLAGEILEDKSKRFAEQNQASLCSLLEPLRLRLGEFQGKVEEVYVQEGKDRSALQEQVRQLVTLNKALSDDAKNLTLALKGSAKTQGGWGELILERVLETSGLRKGIEYVTQQPETRDDGTRAIPDVVIHLPEDRRLVVDAKASLVAYERFTCAANDQERSTALRSHLDSVRTHIRVLSEKRYQDLYGIKSLDFVLAFVPIEPAFMLAVSNDSNLFQEAWDRNVLLVSPSTLLFVVRTVAHLWRQEAQSRNAQEIAKRGAELCDKLTSFVADLQNVGARLKQARDAFDLAEGKLVSGRGNVIWQAKTLRALGVKPTKLLPPSLLELAADGHAAGADPGADEELHHSGNGYGTAN